MLSKRLKVCYHHIQLGMTVLGLTIHTVIARQALAQEDNTDFGNDYPEAIPINLENDRDGCAC